LVHHFALGIFIGKLASDCIFYSFVILSYEMSNQFKKMKEQ
jgi:hypothetical protein